jgi:hypothetical protein
MNPLAKLYRRLLFWFSDENEATRSLEEHRKQAEATQGDTERDTEATEATQPQGPYPEPPRETRATAGGS